MDGQHDHEDLESRIDEFEDDIQDCQRALQQMSEIGIRQEKRFQRVIEIVAGLNAKIADLEKAQAGTKKAPAVSARARAKKGK